MNNLSNPIQEPNLPNPKRQTKDLSLLWDILLLVIMALGAYFRFTGMNWDENQHLHPDERFLTMVASSIEPVKNIGEYFDTSKSSLNPNNRGYGFYVYGTLPLFLVRGIADAVKQTGYDEIFLVGRALSAVFDLMTVLLVYLIVIRLYKKRPMALIAAALTAGSVMQIQLSHYFAVDTFTTFFTTGAVYFAVRILTQKEKSVIPDWIGFESEGNENEKNSFWDDVKKLFMRDLDGIGDVLLFGFFTGCAMASKINSGLVAILIPAAYAVRYLNLADDQRNEKSSIYIRNIAAAAFICILTFRIFQPYAFTGPGFFGLMPNEKWIQSLKELSAQSTGDVDFPPALQWARRPIWFAPENMLLFGMGIPFGLAAFGSFLLMGWRMITANWRKHILIWGWTAVFFTWQATNWVRAMRYQVLDYPTFAIIAAWGIYSIWEKGKLIRHPNRAVFLRAFAIVGGTIVVAGTLIYGYLFTRIYNRPMTRVAASEWIYQNVPAAINMKINTGEEVINHPLAFRANRVISSNEPVNVPFTASSTGSLSVIKLDHVVDTANLPQLKTLTASITDESGSTLTTGSLVNVFPPGNDPRGDGITIPVDMPLTLEKGKNYHLLLTVPDPTISLQAAGVVSLGLVDGSRINDMILTELVDGISKDRPYSIQFTSSATGTISEVNFPKVANLSGDAGQKKFQVTLSATPGGEQILGSSEVFVDFSTNSHSYQKATAKFSDPVKVEKGKPYTLILTDEGDTDLAFFGNKEALESSWDDAIPLGMNGISPFDYNSGPYRSDLNFEMYWDDNQDKLSRFLNILQQADYIFITSNRQWGTTTRVPERYPLTTEYYRNLLGCPEEKDVVWCYRVAQPEMFKGNLGFDLVQVFQSDPGIGSFKINTQFAEEAFTVYDHPKVLIFKKRPDYDQEKVAKILEAVDLTKVVHLLPYRAGSYLGDLTLPKDRLASQQAGGTWMELFNPQFAVNRYPVLGVVVWYLFISLLGWLAYPAVRIATRGLSDHGYGISKIVGIVLLAYFSWLAGSIGLVYSRLSILAVLICLLIASTILFLYQKKEIIDDWHDLKKLFLWMEGISLLLFLAFLGVRLGNPDLWHPYKGGEKPMDFSYFNAVMKSTSFPPYDPWFAGGYINYYYYGFVIVGTPVKLLGITPSVAYNLILPTLFSMVGTAAFTIGYSLIDSFRHPQIQGMAERIRRKFLRTRLASEDPAIVLPSDITDDEYESDRIGSIETIDQEEEKKQEIKTGTINPAAILGGIGSTLLLLILGNLGTIRMIWHGLIKLGSPTGSFENSTYIDRFVWSAQGFWRMVGGMQLPYPSGDWYWIPSRAIPGEPITEFPFFTFLYADLHAHMIALPLTLAILAWTLSLVLRNWEWNREGERLHAGVQLGISLFLGALIVGALRPTNTWDMPTYLVIACVGLVFAGLNSSSTIFFESWQTDEWKKKLVEVALTILGFVLLTFLLYKPFSDWFGQAYNSIDIWKGSRTPSWSYFTHWGVFLVLIVSWFVQETYDWMASTPVSALNRLKPYQNLIWVITALLVIIPVGLIIYGVGIAWMAFPMAAWAGILLFRPGQKPAKRFVLFLVGTALLLTLVVELIVLVGDIGRMNTVFKFYMQAWTMLSISAAFAFILVFPRRFEWPAWLDTVWEIAVFVLLFCAALFPLLGGTDKIRDRISSEAPHTLDGAAYMSTSTFNDNGTIIDLSQDYEGIQWMQQHVKGSPVIVEANTVEYRWGSRYTIYTGLPGVVGWNWHQRQQRAVVPSTTVTDRVDEIKAFYETTDKDETRSFLEKYNVSYIIVGQLESLYYPGAGLQKFQALNGSMWDVVFHNETTTIYQVKKEQ